MYVCAGKNERFDFAMPIGVGLIESAINLTKFLSTNRPEYIIFIGSAGSYGNYKIFDIIHSTIGSNIENSYLEGNSYTPIDNVIEAYKEENVSRETSIIVNSSNYITSNKEISSLYLKQNIQLENMEFYSVLKVSQKFKIPVMGIFIVTNYCYKNGHEEYQKNHKEAKNRLIEHIKGKNEY